MTGRAGRRPQLIFVLAGILAFLLLHLLLVVGWDSFFASPAWPGYEEATRMGLVEPWFVNSPRSLWLTRLLFLSLGFAVTLRSREHRLLPALSFWSGAGLAACVAWLTTRSYAAEWGWLGCVLYPFRLLFPIALGAAAAITLRSGLARRARAS